jgi:hypothetical protein
MSIHNDECYGRFLSASTTDIVARCEMLSWKTKGVLFTVFMTLSNRHMERANEFCHMNSTCNALQQNLCQGSWAMTRRKTASPSAQSLRNSPKIIPTSYPLSLPVMRVKFTDTTLRQSSNHLSESPKKCKFETMWNQIWGFHGGDYEEWCLLGWYAMWLL